MQNINEIHNKNYCADCGSAQTSHFSAKISALMDFLIAPIGNFFEGIRKGVEKLLPKNFENKFGFFLLQTLGELGFGKILHEPDEKNSMRSRVLWEEANRRGINMFEFRLFGIGRDLYGAQFRDEKISFDILPRPSGKESWSLLWMDDKAEMRKHFSEAGIPVANGGDVFFFNSGKKLFKKLEKPIITKPNLGSRSRHTTTEIKTEEEFKKAFLKAKDLSPFIVIEEELMGMVHRGTVIGGKVAGILKREPEMVYGDGVSTVSELIQKENKNEQRKEEKIFHTIKINNEVMDYLKKENLSLGSVPAKDTKVILGEKTSRGAGGSIINVIENAHPENIKMLEDTAKFLDDPLVGFDFILEDISRSWREQKKSGIIECNSMPFIDLHHYPLYGKPVNVASFLWGIVFPNSSPKKHS